MYPSRRSNPSPLATWLTVGGIAGGILVVGFAAARSPRAPAARRAPAPTRPDLPPTDSGMTRAFEGSCDIRAAGEEAFVTYLANVSESVTMRWPPPEERDLEVVVEAMRQAFPSCPWPPTDPGWRARGDAPGEALDWERFVEVIGELFNEVALGTLPWGPAADDHAYDSRAEF